MKSIFFFFAFLVLFSGFVSSQAVQVDFVKDSYLSGETVQAEVVADNVETSLKSNMLKLYQNGSFVSTSFNLIKLNSTYYYLYFDLDNDFSGGHELVFENVLFSENGSTHQSDFSFDLNVQVTNSSVFLINPGFVKADNLQFNNLFYVYLFNQGDEFVNVGVNSEDSFIDFSVDIVSLSAGGSGYFTIYLSDLLVSGESGIKYVDLSSGPFGYSLPIWLGFDEETVDVEEGGVYFVESSEFFEVTINKGELLEGGYVRFENGFDYTVDLNFNLTGGLDEVVSLEYGSLNDVEPGEIVSLGLGHVYYYDKDKYTSKLKKTEEKARASELGIWKKSSRFGCLELVKLKYEEEERCNNQEQLIIENKCESFSAVIKDDATHLYDVNLKQGSFVRNFSCIWNNNGDSVYIWDDEGLVLFYRY